MIVINNNRNIYVNNINIAQTYIARKQLLLKIKNLLLNLLNREMIKCFFYKSVWRIAQNIVSKLSISKLNQNTKQISCNM